MGHPVEVAVLEHVRAVNAGDLEALMAGFAPGARFQTGDHVVTGTDAIRPFFAEAFAGVRPQLQVSNLFLADGRAACELLDTVSLEGGEQRTYRSAAFFTVEGPLITAVTVYREGRADIDS
jgi:hypothetical protein